VKETACALLQQYTDYISQADMLLTVVQKACNSLSAVLFLCEASISISNAISKEDRLSQGDRLSQEEFLLMLREWTEFAERERDRGFPLLYAHTTVAAWGALEAAITDFLVFWITEKPEVLKTEVFTGTKIPLAEFETLERDERMRLLVNELERSLRSQFKAGASRFEALLSAIELSGPMEEETRKDLYEMFHVRNVIVHRASIADRKFVEACPWLGYSIGDQLVVSSEDWERYRTATAGYLAKVGERAAKRLQEQQRPTETVPLTTE
jgi:hypothetical protein